MVARSLIATVMLASCSGATLTQAPSPAQHLSRTAGATSPAARVTGTPTARPSIALTAAPTQPSRDVRPAACGDATLLHDARLGMVLANCVGQLAGQSHEQIWAWGDGAWQLVDDEGPPATVVAGMTLDIDRQVWVRYGGLPMSSNDCVSETWEWSRDDGWARVSSEGDSLPTACDHMKLAFDAARGVTILVGGGVLQELSDETWAWDGRAWSRLATGGPAARAHHGLVYDAAHEQTFLYGGYDGIQVFDDFWSWDGDAWHELDFPGPGPRSHAGLAVSPVGMLFGGATGPSTFQSLTADTWLLTEGHWEEVSADGPSSRGSPALDYDPTTETWLLYGGFADDGSELGDTWRFDGTTWECVDVCEAPNRILRG
jgi:hypothetical protein